MTAIPAKRRQPRAAGTCRSGRPAANLQLSGFGAALASVGITESARYERPRF